MKRYSILIITPFFPYPPTDGGKICIFGFIDYLRKDYDFHLFIPVKTYDEVVELDKLKFKWPNVRFHIVDETPPRSRASAIKRFVGERWVVGLLRILKMVMPKKDINATDPYSFYKNLSNVFPFVPQESKYVIKLAEVLAGTQFDIVQTELTPVLNLVHLIPDGVKKIFVQIESREDVLRDYGWNSQINSRYGNYIADNAAFMEYNYMSLYDAVFTLNENDQKVISSHCPTLKVYNSPFALLDEQFGSVPTDYRFKRLIFIGGENHYPNFDGLRWFLTDVAPLLTGHPELIVTGNWRESTIAEFRQLYKSIVFTGFVEDISLLFNGSISIAPIRLGGGGLRTKVLFSMANYSPVVATSIALAGIQGDSHKQFLIANSPHDFASEIEWLFQHPEKAKEITHHARNVMENTYSQRIMGEKRKGYYNEILKANG